jgi:acyl-CoA oxidase
MVKEAGNALRSTGRMPQAEAAALFNEHQNELIEAARAHAELLQWEAFTRALPGIGDRDTRQVLTWVRDLFGLGLVEKNLGWYLMNGRLSAQRARTLGDYINRLLARLRPFSQDLVDAFGYGPEHLRAKIASGAEGMRQVEAMAYARTLRASGEAPVDEKILIARQKAAAKLEKRQAPAGS